MGVTYLMSNSNVMKKTLQTDVPIMSQFGWQFEWGTYPLSGGPAFVFELVPFFSGVEYGYFIPSINTIIGIRLPSGFEFGMGPNIAIGVNDKAFSTSLTLAIGKTFNFDGVYLPFNLACVTGRYGSRLSFIFGYAL